MNRPYDPLQPHDPTPDDADDLKRLWRSQPAPAADFTIDDLHRTASRFQRTVALRNAVEYLGCGLVVLIFAYYAVTLPYLLMRAGSVLFIVGALVVAWQLHARASTQPKPEDRGEHAWIDYQRRQLERQRDALRSVAFWYLGPFVPGTVVFRWGIETELGAGTPFAQGFVANLAIAAFFVAVILVNRFASHKLQQRIERLNEEAR